MASALTSALPHGVGPEASTTATKSAVPLRQRFPGKLPRLRTSPSLAAKPILTLLVDGSQITERLRLPTQMKEMTVMEKEKLLP